MSKLSSKISNNSAAPINEAWAKKEFSKVSFGDKRLKNRLITLANKLSEHPESSINMACETWTEAKAAYRFFQNENVSPAEILSTHVEKTVEKAKDQTIILAIQDTCYISYTTHGKTKDIDPIIVKKIDKDKKKAVCTGIIMHTTFAVAPDGVPLGLLDQRLYTPQNTSQQVEQKIDHHDVLIDKKESVRWQLSLEKVKNNFTSQHTNPVTIGDREADIYELFEYANNHSSYFIVRAAQDRKLYCEKKGEACKLWSSMEKTPSIGQIQVDIPKKGEQAGRLALLNVRIATIQLPGPARHIRNKSKKLPILSLNAIHVSESCNPDSEDV